MKRNENELKYGIILNYVNMILGNMIPIFYTPVMLELLGQEEYGLYKLSGSVTSYLSLISLGIGSAVTRYLIKAKEQEGKEAEERMLGLFNIVFQVIAVISLLVGTTLILSIQNWYGDSLSATELSRMKTLVFIMVCNTALGFSQTPYITVISAHERFVFQQSTNIAVTLAGPLLNIVMLKMGYASIGMATVSLLTTIVCRVVNMVYVRKNMMIKARYRNMPVSLLREILIFSFWVFVANIVSQLNNATDTVMIGAVPALATTGVAIYSVGNTFNSIIFSLTTGVSSLLAPKVSKMVFAGADGKALTELAIRVGRIQGYIFTLLVSGFIAFGKPFIQLYAGSGYEEAYWVAVFMMVPNLVPLVQSVCLSVIVAQNKHKFRSLVYLGIAIANVIGTWFLLRTWGIIGASFMTGVALVIGQGFVMNWYYQNRTEMNMVLFWRELCKICVIPTILCVIAIIMSYIVDFYNPFVMVVGIALYITFFAALSWRFAMNDDEKMLLFRILKR